MIQQYGKAVLRQLMVNGVDISQSLSTLFTGTSILTPFQMCKFSVMDGSRIQDALYESGVPISIVYSAGDGSIIRELQLLSMANRGGNKTEGNRAGATEISAVSESFFNMHNEHSSQHQNITASDALQKIHKEMDPQSSLSVTKTKGLIGDREPFHLRGVQLGKGISMIRARMTDEKFKSSAFTYFKDHLGGYIAKPIEQLFSEAAGPTFTQKVAGMSFIKEQSALAHNIFSMEKGSPGEESGTDNAALYRQTLKQRGGDVGTGFNWQNMQYKAPTAKTYSNNTYPGKSEWKGPTAPSATMTNHKFNYDPNQKKQEDFEGDQANKNIKTAMALQGSMTVNIPMEGGMKCTVGKGCYLDIPAESGTQGAGKSSAGGQHLVLAHGEYLFLGDGGLTGTVSLHTASGGKSS